MSPVLSSAQLVPSNEPPRTRSHALSHDGGLMRVSHHLLWMGDSPTEVSTASGSRRCGKLLMVLSFSVLVCRSKVASLWPFARPWKFPLSDRMAMRRIRIDGLSETDAGHCDFGPSTGSPLVPCESSKMGARFSQSTGQAYAESLRCQAYLLYAWQSATSRIAVDITTGTSRRIPAVFVLSRLLEMHFVGLQVILRIPYMRR